MSVVVVVFLVGFGADAWQLKKVAMAVVVKEGIVIGVEVERGKRTEDE